MTIGAKSNRAPLRPIIPIDPLESGATRFPPFAREVEVAIAAGKRPNVYLFVGSDAWVRARRRRDACGLGTALLLPARNGANAYRWPRVPSGILLVANSQPRALAFGLARAVVSGGTPIVFAIFGENEALIVRSSAWPGLAEQSA